MENSENVASNPASRFIQAAKRRFNKTFRSNHPVPEQSSGTGSENEDLIQDLIQRYGLKVNRSVLIEVIDGLHAGMNWVLERYQRVDSPQILIGHHTGSMVGISGLTVTTTGEKIIGLQVDELRKLEGSRLFPKRIIEDNGSDVPIKPKLTIRQHYEGFGIEETLHWLQDKGIEGLAKLPPPEERLNPISERGLKYMLQPHEFQALVLEGEYFKEKYGRNPLQKLEEFIRSKQT